MHLGLVVPNRGPTAVDNVKRFPRLYETLGYNSAWFTDHVVGVRTFEPVYGGAWAESLTSLSYAAANTSAIRLGVGILVAPYRNPVLAAKSLVTLDGLSDGRLNVGVGAGWARSEFHALGAGDLFDVRGRFTDEAIEVMARVFEGGEFGWDGEWVKFRRLQAEPLPVQRPHPPFWIGGQGGLALRRAARWADVWHPTRLTPGEVASIGSGLDERAGREIPRAVRIRVPPGTDIEQHLELLGEYREAGCSEVVMEYDTDEGPAVADFAEELAIAADLAPRA